MLRQVINNQRTICPTVETALAAFLTDCHVRQLAHKTVKFYREKLKRFVSFCESQAVTTLDQVDTNLLRRFFLWLEENGNNPGGRHAYFRTLRAAFRWLESEYEGYVSPLRKIKPPRLDDVPIEGVSIEDIKKMLDACNSNTFTGIRDRALILTLLDTGIRIGECLALDWNDVDLINGSILIRRGKNRRPRVVYLGKSTRLALRKYARFRHDEQPAVWVTKQGERLKYFGVREILRRLAKQAGLEKVPSPHDFRRTCALTLLRNGADLLSVSRLLGHTSLEVTKRYLAQTQNDLMEVHQRHSPANNL